MAEVEHRDDGVAIRFEGGEVGVFEGLLDEMETLLQADIPRLDPVVERLFPEAYDDPEDQEVYEEMVGASLRNGKVEALREVRSRLAPVTEVPRAEVDMWLTVLTDLRLAIGTRLGVDEARMASPYDPGSPDAAAMGALHWLGWMQEAILEHIMGGNG